MRSKRCSVWWARIATLVVIVSLQIPYSMPIRSPPLYSLYYYYECGKTFPTKDPCKAEWTDPSAQCQRYDNIYILFSNWFDFKCQESKRASEQEVSERWPIEWWRGCRWMKIKWTGKRSGEEKERERQSTKIDFSNSNQNSVILFACLLAFFWSKWNDWRKLLWDKMSWTILLNMNMNGHSTYQQN